VTLTATLQIQKGLHPQLTELSPDANTFKLPAWNFQLKKLSFWIFFSPNSTAQVEFQSMRHDFISTSFLMMQS